MKRFVCLGLVLGLISVALPAMGKSLWSDRSPMNYMVTDANAQKVGEILTILIQEDNRANDSADGSGKRSQSTNGVISMLWNNKFMRKLFGGSGEGPAVQASTDNDFQGESQVDRTSTFSSKIAATIVQIDEAGNYLIEARKTIRVGQERKTIVLSGKIRPRDIINNMVFSHQVADAEISYIGDGTLTKMNNPTMLQKFFHFLF
ncbi:MAG: flagellar basal body L-ring protein FlgH [bacterium]|jgi:flagellar L-ring protein precursor FlgH|nr:flagellar basal body L-ring protein FlgH [bacterium]